MVFNITADNIHVYNLTIRYKTLTHDAKHAINGELECDILSKSLMTTTAMKFHKNSSVEIMLHQQKHVTKETTFLDIPQN
jgi:hypothetical protein